MNFQERLGVLRDKHGIITITNCEPIGNEQNRTCMNGLGPGPLGANARKSISQQIAPSYGYKSVSQELTKTGMGESNVILCEKNFHRNLLLYTCIRNCITDFNRCVT